jgi:hypothetical protein
MDETTKAYIAGIMDSDGSIGIYVGRSQKGYGSHVLQVTVAMSDPQAVELIAGVCGVPTHVRKGRGNSKNALTVVLRADKALQLLRDIAPYMRVKRAHANLGIAFQESKTNFIRRNRKGWGGGRDKLTDEEWSKREQFRLQMYAINSSRLGANPKPRAVAETEWDGSFRKPKGQATVRPPQECGEAGRNDQPPSEMRE